MATAVRAKAVDKKLKKGSGLMQATMTRNGGRGMLRALAGYERQDRPVRRVTVRSASCVVCLERAFPAFEGTVILVVSRPGSPRLLKRRTNELRLVL